MNYRLNTKMMVLVTVLVLVAIGLFVYTLVSAPTEEEDRQDETTPVAMQTEERLISAKHQYVDGIHTVAGTIDLPTPCHKLVAEPFFTADKEGVVEIRFSTALEGDSCAAVVTPVPFRVSFEAPEDITINASYNGTSARLNRVPLQPGETFEDTLYIKG